MVTNTSQTKKKKPNKQHETNLFLARFLGPAPGCWSAADDIALPLHRVWYLQTLVHNTTPLFCFVVTSFEEHSIIVLGLVNTVIKKKQEVKIL